MSSDLPTDSAAAETAEQDEGGLESAEMDDDDDDDENGGHDNDDDDYHDEENRIYDPKFDATVYHQGFHQVKLYHGERSSKSNSSGGSCCGGFCCYPRRGRGSGPEEGEEESTEDYTDLAAEPLISIFYLVSGPAGLDGEGNDGDDNSREKSQRAQCDASSDEHAEYAKAAAAATSSSSLRGQGSNCPQEEEGDEAKSATMPDPRSNPPPPPLAPPPTTPVVMIMGLGVDHKGWIFQARRLAQTRLLLLVDNRGIGKSDSPKETDAYRTDLMARDTLAILDHLRWPKAHVVGFSMGGMIAMAFATISPERVASLSVINSSRGGWDALPSLSSMRLFIKASQAKTPEDRAKLDLECHFTRRFLGRSAAKYEMIFQEYVGNSQDTKPTDGVRGQMSAVWNHKLTKADYLAVKRGPFSKLVIHGRKDKVLSYRRGQLLAKLISAEFHLLEAAHLSVRERAGMVNTRLDAHFCQADREQR